MRLAVASFVVCAGMFGDLAIATAAPPTPAETRVEDADRRTRARSLANDGYALFQAGRFEDALRIFERADSVYHATTIALMAARCAVELGRLEEAAARFRRILDEPLPEPASEAFVEARRAAAEELAPVAAKLGRIRVALPAGGRPRLRIDGEERSREAVEPSVFLRAGEHRFELLNGDEVASSRTIVVVGGDDRSVRFDDASSSDASALGRGRLTGGLVALGVAAAGFAVGATTGVFAIHEQSRLESLCPTKRCAPDLASVADSANRYATVSTVGLVTGGVAAALGVAVLVWPASRSVGNGSRASSPHLAVEVGPAGAWVRGRF